MCSRCAGKSYSVANTARVVILKCQANLQGRGRQAAPFHRRGAPRVTRNIMLEPSLPPDPLVEHWLARHLTWTSFVLHMIGIPPTILGCCSFPSISHSDRCRSSGWHWRFLSAAMSSNSLDTCSRGRTRGKSSTSNANSAGRMSSSLRPVRPSSNRIPRSRNARTDALTGWPPRAGLVSRWVTTGRSPTTGRENPTSLLALIFPPV